MAQRLLSKIVEIDGCWVWQGSCDHAGYSQIQAYGRNWKGYKLSYLIHKGEWPIGRDVMHSCDNRKCVNPDHLRLGTRAENLADMKAKGRHAHGTRFPHAKLDDDAVRDIVASPDSNRVAALRYGVNPSVVSRIRNGKVWRHVTCR